MLRSGNQLSEGVKDMQRKAAGGFVKRAEEQGFSSVEQGEGVEMAWLVSREDGAQNFEMRKFRIKPGGGLPKHMHPEIEHEQYVLKGRMKVGINNEVHDVKAGDVIYIPAGAFHWYVNDSDEDVEFICVIPKKNEYKTVYDKC